MGIETPESKPALRRQVRQQLHRMTPAQRADESKRARALLVAQPRWLAAQAILFYAPLPEELDIWPLLADALSAHRGVTLPRFDVEAQSYTPCRIGDLDRDVKAGQFGIREAADHCPEMSLNRLDLLLVPGVAFDLLGRRLGRGKGFYDQLLAGAGGTICGVAFDQQIVREIPVAPHDVQVNCILTPTRWIEL